MVVWKRRTQTGLILTATLGLLVWISVAPATAQEKAKLIHMSNGKILVATAVVQDGAWVRATLEGGHEVGIQAALVEFVEDDLGGIAEAVGQNLNVVTSGRFVPRSSTFSASRQRNNNPLEGKAGAQGGQPAAGAVTLPGGVARPGVATPGAQPGVQPAQAIPGVQPIQQGIGRNQQPAGSRRRNIGSRRTIDRDN
jgi:hypothetical protein